MFRRFTQRARNAVIHAQEEARQLNHPAIGTEHILLGVLREGEGVGAKALMSMGTDLEKVRAEVTKLIGERGDSPQAAVGDLPITPGAKKVFNLSFEEARLQGVNYVGTEHLLLAILQINLLLILPILLSLLEHYTLKPHNNYVEFKRIRTTTPQHNNLHSHGRPRVLILSAAFSFI
jgi:ATP-dependent Clp protease ATP-binding subunit ClpC